MSEEELKNIFLNRCKQFMAAYMKASTRGQFIMGSYTKSKNDIRKEFIKDLDMIKGMAQLFNNPEVLGLINTQLSAVKEEVETTNEFLEGAGE